MWICRTVATAMALVLAFGSAPASERDDFISWAELGDSRLLSDHELHASATGVVPRPDDALMAAVRNLADPPIGSVGEGRGGPFVVGIVLRGRTLTMSAVSQNLSP